MQSKESPQSPKVKIVEISAEYAGQRVDNFLLRHLNGVPKSLVYRILRKGEVRVNKGRIKPEYKLQAGDFLRIPPLREAEKKPPGQASDKVLAQIERRIIFEDERILVLNKPSGIAVHGGSGLNYGVIEALRALRPQVKQLELVHRLDRDTSGCLLIAKKRSVLRFLHEQLREGKVDKRYLTLLKGQWQGGSQWVDAPLLKNVVRSGERIVLVNANGKEARTLFSPASVSDKASLMRVKLDTGRTHQIRVHGQYIDHPLAGDEKYGNEEFNRQLKKLGLKRLFLHAFSLKFKLPSLVSEAKAEDALYLEAPLDDALETVLKRLELKL